jgi:hypothetical protein
VYSYGPNGAVTSDTTAAYNTFPYDPRERAWYMAAESAGKGIWCPIFMVSPVVPPATIPGLSFATPFYSATGELQAVCASDIDSRNVIDVLAPLAQADMSTLVYVVEDTTLILLGSSIGEHSTYSDGAISPATEANNWIIKQSATALLEADGVTFKADGAYTVQVDGSDDDFLCVQLTSYSDSASSTTLWKIVAVVQSDECDAGDDYERPLGETAAMMLADTAQILSAVGSLSEVLNFHSGSSITAPLSDSVLARTTEPAISGISQQSTWALTNSVIDLADVLVRTLYKKNVLRMSMYYFNILILFLCIYLQYSVGTVWVAGGTYLSYTFLGISSPLLTYRGEEGTASCPAFGSYPPIPTDCTQLYNTASDGTAGVQSSQLQYDARNEEWYSIATERGSNSWAGPSYSNFSADRVLVHSMPNYDPETAAFHSVSSASIRLSYCKYKYLL